MSVPSSNSARITVEPWEVSLSTRRMPAMVLIDSSRTSVTSSSTTSGLAPSRVAITVTTGKLSSGYWSTPRRW